MIVRQKKLLACCGNNFPQIRSFLASHALTADTRIQWHSGHSEQTACPSECPTQAAFQKTPIDPKIGDIRYGISALSRPSTDSTWTSSISHSRLPSAGSNLHKHLQHFSTCACTPAVLVALDERNGLRWYSKGGKGGGNKSKRRGSGSSRDEDEDDDDEEDDDVDDRKGKKGSKGRSKQAGGKKGKSGSGKSRRHEDDEDDEEGGEDEGEVDVRADAVGRTNSSGKHALEHMRKELGKIRTGRATPSLLDHVVASLAGRNTPLPHIATVAVKDAQMLSVTLHDASHLSAVMKGIQSSPMGFNPTSPSDTLIHVPVPAMTQEVRQAMHKLLVQAFESALKIARQGRKEAMDMIKKAKPPEDYKRRAEKEVEAAHTAAVHPLEKLKQEKEKEINKS